MQNIGIEIVSVAEGFGIGAQIIGRCEGKQGENSLIIDSGYGKFTYPRNTAYNFTIKADERRALAVELSCGSACMIGLYCHSSSRI